MQTCLIRLAITSAAFTMTTLSASAQWNNSGCLSLDPSACGEAIWESYAGSAGGSEFDDIYDSIDDLNPGGGFDHKTPAEIAACIQVCEQHRQESVNACRIVYGSGSGDADHCTSAVTARYTRCVQSCND